METLELIIFASLVIWGVYASIQEGMIFEKIGFLLRGKQDLDGDNNYYVKYRDDLLPEWLRKPLGTCPICMSSIYGTIIYAFAYFGGWIDLDYQFVHYICYVFAVSGLNYVILNY